MNAITLFVMSALLPVLDIIWNMKRVGLLGSLATQINTLIHTEIPLGMRVLIVILPIVILLANWLAVKAFNWAINKANKRFGESSVGTTIMFLTMILPLIAQAMHH